MIEKRKNLVIVLEVSPQGAVPSEFKVCDAVTAEVLEDAVTFSEDTLTKEIEAAGYIPITDRYENIRFDTFVKELYVKRVNDVEL